MNFIRGVIAGSIITAGTLMYYSEGMDDSKKKMMKKGKIIMKKIKASL